MKTRKTKGSMKAKRNMPMKNVESTWENWIEGFNLKINECEKHNAACLTIIVKLEQNQSVSDGDTKQKSKAAIGNSTDNVGNKNIETVLVLGSIHGKDFVQQHQNYALQFVNYIKNISQTPQSTCQVCNVAVRERNQENPEQEPEENKTDIKTIQIKTENENEIIEDTNKNDVIDIIESDTNNTKKEIKIIDDKDNNDMKDLSIVNEKYTSVNESEIENPQNTDNVIIDDNKQEDNDSYDDDDDENDSEWDMNGSLKNNGIFTLVEKSKGATQNDETDDLSISGNDTFGYDAENSNDKNCDVTVGKEVNDHKGKQLKSNIIQSNETISGRIKNARRQTSKSGSMKYEHPESNRRLKCKYCSETFSCARDKQAHKNAKHDSSELYRLRQLRFKSKKKYCRRCHLEFATHEELLSHRGSVHDGSKNKKNRGCPKSKENYCKRCHLEFATHEELHSHRESVHDGPKKQKNRVRPIKGYQCKFCPEIFPTMAERMAHKAKDHQTFPCEQCDKIYPSHHLYLRHKRNSHELMRSMPCPICGKLFISEHRVRNHVELVHTDKKMYPCQKCGKLFKTANCVRTHSRVHKEAEFCCQYCGRYFKSHQGLKAHLIEHTAESDYKCEVCEKVLKDEREYKAHMFSSHGGPAPEICPICGQGYSSKYSLNTHMKLHSDIKRHQCPNCDKAFHHVSNLYDHMRTHKPKAFHCQYCTKQFSRKTDLKKHVERIHIWN